MPNTAHLQMQNEHIVLALYTFCAILRLYDARCVIGNICFLKFLQRYNNFCKYANLLGFYFSIVVNFFNISADWAKLVIYDYPKTIALSIFAAEDALLRQANSK